MNYAYSKWHWRVLLNGKPANACKGKGSLSLSLTKFTRKLYTERCQRCSTLLAKVQRRQ